MDNKIPFLRKYLNHSEKNLNQNFNSLDHTFHNHPAVLISTLCIFEHDKVEEIESFHVHKRKGVSQGILRIGKLSEYEDF